MREIPGFGAHRESHSRWIVQDFRVPGRPLDLQGTDGMFEPDCIASILNWKISLSWSIKLTVIGIVGHDA